VGGEAPPTALSLGPRWVRAATVHYGHRWSPTVAHGAEKPQVTSRPAHAVGTMQTGDSGCGPDCRTPPVRLRLLAPAASPP
jgi:hypothetical protein